MLEHKRKVAMILAGFFILAAAASPSGTPRTNENVNSVAINKNLSDIAAAQMKMTKTSESVDYQQPCSDGEYNKRSDLCAQWYAARAARDSANWAWWSLITGAIGAIGIIAALILTMESNRIAASTAQKQLRAYVGVKHWEPRWHTDTSNNSIWYSMRPILENYGATPTKQLKSTASLMFTDTEIDENYDFINPDTDVIVPIPPNSTVEGVQLTITGDKLDAVRRGTHMLYVWGTAEYLDIFDHQRSTKFAYRVFIRGNPIRPPVDGNTLEWRWEMLNRHNCID